MNELIDKINETLQGNEELQKKYFDEMKRLTESGEAITPDEAYVKAVKSVLDIDLSLSDLEKFRAENEVLDPEELKAISGGDGENRNNTARCTSNYACHYVYYHPDDAQPGEACFNNWLCLGFWNCVKGPN